MKNGIYGLKNMLSGRYEEVYSMATDGLAQRILGKLILDRKERTGENFEDKKLYKMGQHDIETGKIEPEEIPIYIPWELPKTIEAKANKEE